MKFHIFFNAKLLHGKSYFFIQKIFQKEKVIFQSYCDNLYLGDLMNSFGPDLMIKLFIYIYLMYLRKLIEFEIENFGKIEDSEVYI